MKRFVNHFSKIFMELKIIKISHQKIINSLKKELTNDDTLVVFLSLQKIFSGKYKIINFTIKKNKNFLLKREIFKYINEIFCILKILRNKL